MLDVKRMTMLRDLAEHGRVTTVADLHGVTPSAVSQQLRVLESEAGIPLLHREGRTLRLTAAGAALTVECERVLASLERAESAMRALDGALSGELSLGCAPSALSSVAAPLVAELSSRHPLLRPRIVQAEPEEAAPLLKQHKVQLAISYRYHLLGASPPSGTHAVPLFDDPLALAIPEALREDVARGGLAVLSDLAWVSAPEPSTCRDVLVHACRNAGFTPRIEHECADLRSALSLVATGLAVSLLPNLLCSSPPPGTAIVPQPGKGRTIEAVVRAGTESHPAIAATLSALTELTALTALTERTDRMG
jgi:DNA-binding transcriptional LysR family regulator